MSAARHKSVTEVPLGARIEALEKVLVAQLADYRALLGCMEQKSEAIRHAHMDRISDVFQQESLIVQRLSDSERARVDLIRAISSALRPDDDKLLRVSEIAEAHQEESARARLLAIAEQLRKAATEVKERSSKMRAAAEALARHMSGVMQSVRSALSRAGVYEQKGRLAVGAQIDFSVDIRS